MPSPTTEELHDMAVGLDQRQPRQVAQILVEGQIAAAGCVAPAVAALCDGAHAMAQSLLAGGSLYYVAAGSSGLMAAADAMELGGTYGIGADRVHIVMAGGLPTSATMPGDTEDDRSGLDEALQALSSADTMIAVAASGRTPYTLNAAQTARARGATLLAIANNAASPLLELADVPVLLATPPEVIAGSTRMGAGTAQKIALNTLSTLMAVELGHVCDGMMVNLVADNDKLRERAATIVETITGASQPAAARALAAAGGAVKPAVLLAAGATTPASARALLEETQGNLRRALSRLRGT